MKIEEIFNIRNECIVGNFIPKTQFYEFGGLKSRDKAIFRRY